MTESDDAFKFTPRAWLIPALIIASGMNKNDLCDGDIRMEYLSVEEHDVREKTILKRIEKLREFLKKYNNKYNTEPGLCQCNDCPCCWAQFALEADEKAD